MSRAGLLLVLLATSSPTAAPSTQFPGERRELASPDTRWVLRWIPADESANGEHSLVLRSRQTGVARQVLSFPRHVTVAWAPDGRHFAVTNYTGSTDGESFVYSVEATPARSIEALIEQQHPGSLSVTVGAGHRYIEVIRWLDSKTVSVRVWGYGGKHDFDKRLRVDLRE